MTDLTAINTSGAKLPQTYQAAKRAISECVSIDECKDWSDKAAALASYARQAKDDQLERMATRIRARATRRAGELLRQIEPAPGLRTDLGPLPSIGSRKQAAYEAGLSERQAKTAQRLASVPDHDFEELVERGATITEMAEIGTEKRAQQRDEAKVLMDAMRAYSERLRDVDLDAALSGVSEIQKAEIKALVSRLDGIHDRIATGI